SSNSRREPLMPMWVNSAAIVSGKNTAVEIHAFLLSPRNDEIESATFATRGAISQRSSFPREELAADGSALTSSAPHCHSSNMKTCTRDGGRPRSRFARLTVAPKKLRNYAAPFDAGQHTLGSITLFTFLLR